MHGLQGTKIIFLVKIFSQMQEKMMRKQLFPEKELRIAHEDGHNLAFTEFSLVVSAAFSATVLRWQTEVILQFFVQIFVKLVDNTENFSNFCQW